MYYSLLHHKSKNYGVILIPSTYGYVIGLNMVKPANLTGEGHIVGSESTEAAIWWSDLRFRGTRGTRGMDAATVAADQASSSWTYSKYLENTWKIPSSSFFQVFSTFFAQPVRDLVGTF